MLILGFLPTQRITMFTAHYKKRGCIVKLDYETASSCGRVTDLRTFYEDYLKCIEFCE